MSDKEFGIYVNTSPFTDIPDMTPQQFQDFGPILEQFPEADLDDQGYPCVFAFLEETDEDHPMAVIHADGSVEIEDEDGGPAKVQPKDLRKLADMAEIAMGLFEDWLKSPSGQTWRDEYGQDDEVEGAA